MAPKWIIPPGLILPATSITINCNNSYSDEEYPILIYGPSGIEKSFLLKLLGNIRKTEVVQCSRIKEEHLKNILDHLIHESGGNSGYCLGPNNNIVPSRFYKKIYILDHIDELSKENQDKLLSFLLGNKFSKESKYSIEKQIDIRIVATTDKPLDFFRNDFIDSFSLIKITPIYERRVDILYYLKHFYPEVIKQLTPVEVLVLLAYNWPVNFFEVKKVGDLLQEHFL